MTEALFQDPLPPNYYEQYVAVVWSRIWKFNSWPRYYRRLLTCENPSYYNIRYFQVIFCIINQITLDDFREFIVYLNPHGRFISDRVWNKIRHLFDYIPRKAQLYPHLFKSYNINLDSISDIYNNRYETTEPDEPVRYIHCDSVYRLHNNIGVSDIISVD